MPKVRHFQAIVDLRRRYEEIESDLTQSWTTKEMIDLIHLPTLRNMGYENLDGDFLEDLNTLKYLSFVGFGYSLCKDNQLLYKPTTESVIRVFTNALKYEKSLPKINWGDKDLEKYIERANKHFLGMCELYPERFINNDVWVQKLPDILYSWK